MFSAHVGPYHKFAHGVGSMALRELGECFGQSGMQVDAGDLAVLDQHGDDRPVVFAFVRACKGRVLAIESQRTDRPLDSVGIHLNATVIEEQ